MLDVKEGLEEEESFLGLDKKAELGRLVISKGAARMIYIKKGIKAPISS